MTKERKIGLSHDEAALGNEAVAYYARRAAEYESGPAPL